MVDDSIIYDRNVLYEEVWAEPIRDVAKRYGVSDVALAKMCRRLDVPVRVDVLCQPAWGVVDPRE